MPLTPLKICKWVGCSNLTRATYCLEHQHIKEQEQHKRRLEYEQNRRSAADRGYDADWRAIREVYLRQNPLCERCGKQGRVVRATLVHHKLKIRDGGTHTNSNLEAMCVTCHQHHHEQDRWTAGAKPVGNTKRTKRDD